MNKNVLIVLAGGFLVAILVAVLVNASLNGGKKTTAVATQDAPTMEVLVASKDLAIGREISGADMKWQAWPQNALFPGAITRDSDEVNAEDLVQGRLSQDIAEGQPILPAFLISESRGNFMAASLGDGMRALGVSVKAETMAGGFIGPGDRVDVLLTYSVKVRARDNAQIAATIVEYASETLLENVRVLAVDQSSQREEDKANVGRTVTLEVTSEQAEKLALASEMGDITLSLRSLGDEKSVADNNMTTDVRMSKILKKVSRMQSSSNGSGGIVRVYNGEELTNVPVRQSIPLDDE